MLHANSLVSTSCLRWCATPAHIQLGPGVSGTISRWDLPETGGLCQEEHDVNGRIFSSTALSPFGVTFIHFLTVCFLIHSQTWAFFSSVSYHQHQFHQFVKLHMQQLVLSWPSREKRILSIELPRECILSYQLNTKQCIRLVHGGH